MLFSLPGSVDENFTPVPIQRIWSSVWSTMPSFHCLLWMRMFCGLKARQFMLSINLCLEYRGRNGWCTLLNIYWYRGAFDINILNNSWLRQLIFIVGGVKQLVLIGWFKGVTVCSMLLRVNRQMFFFFHFPFRPLVFLWKACSEILIGLFDFCPFCTGWLIRDTCSL